MPITATYYDFTQARRRRASPLWWLVPLSLLLHAGLFYYWKSSPVPVATDNSSDMTVRLIERSQPTPVAEIQPPTPTATTSPKQTIKKAPHSKPTIAKPEPAETTNASLSPDTPTPRESFAAAEAESKPDQVEEAALQSRLKITLRQELARHFNYPMLARKRGWQGEVLLAFRLEADGRIIDARVARSSGYGVLDRAALEALGKVKRLNPGTLHGFAMRIPVIYRLEG